MLLCYYPVPPIMIIFVTVVLRFDIQKQPIVEAHVFSLLIRALSCFLLLLLTISNAQDHLSTHKRINDNLYSGFYIQCRK